MPMNPRLLRPTPSGFDPRRIAGLQLWLDAADASSLTIDTGVSEWRDKSGRAKHFVQVTGNNQPSATTQTIGGRVALGFDGTNDTLSCSEAIPNTRPMTFFLVQRIVTKTSFGMSYTSGSGGSTFEIRQSFNSGGLNVVASGGNNINNAASDRLGINDVIVLSYPASGNMAGFVNGATAPLETAPAASPGLSGTHFIGQRTDGFFGNVAIGEIIAYNTLLSVAQRLAVQAYLGRKWGITIA
jgi:hypothetical protein